MKTAKAHNDQLTGFVDLAPFRRGRYECSREPSFDPEITFCAFRYALGRRTYIVGTVVEYLVKNWEWMTPKYQQLIHKEIDEAEKRDGLGHDCDKAEWTKVRGLPLSSKTE